MWHRVWARVCGASLPVPAAATLATVCLAARRGEGADPGINDSVCGRRGARRPVCTSVRPFFRPQHSLPFSYRIPLCFPAFSSYLFHLHRLPRALYLFCSHLPILFLLLFTFPPILYSIYPFRSSFFFIFSAFSSCCSLPLQLSSLLIVPLSFCSSSLPVPLLYCRVYHRL